MAKEAFIPLAVPNICGRELEYVKQAIKTQWISTGGMYITEFEEQFAKYLGAGEACACQSGTAGLHLCLRHFGIGRGDRVLVPTLTFVATINAVRYQEAIPVFFDCTDNLCIETKQVKSYIEEQCLFDGQELREKESGERVKAIIPVHVFGDTCEMEEIMEMASKYKLIVIEDATESLGTVFKEGRYKGLQTGVVGDAGVFSFNGNKIMTTGGGGMIVSSDSEAIHHMRYLSQQAKDDAVYFVHDEVGYNYRMTNLQAAFGLAQLEQLDYFITSKKRNFKLYREMLVSCKFGQLLPFYASEGANHWFYSFKLHTPSIEQRDQLIQYLGKHSIQVRPIWKLNHTQKPFRSFTHTTYPKAEMFYQSVINLPCSTQLTEEEVSRVAKTLLSFC